MTDTCLAKLYEQVDMSTVIYIFVMSNVIVIYVYVNSDVTCLEATCPVNAVMIYVG